MSSGHDDKFDGLFGEEEEHVRRPAPPPHCPPLAGLFGAKHCLIRERDRKSPAAMAQDPGSRR